MCGLAGLFGTSTIAVNPQLPLAVRRMTQQLQHRGPDDHGVWWRSDDPCVLGHRRLAVLDLSAQGSQPMESHCGRFVIAYNGEVYNFDELRLLVRKASPNVMWRGRSDTEVILECIATFGLRSAISRFNGMFAFALWDRREQTLSLARDRLGKKPLYFMWSSSGLAFASEVKALAQLADWTFDIDQGALLAYLRHGYVPAPHTGFSGVRKVRPGEILCFHAHHIARRREPEASKYWMPSQLLQSGVKSHFGAKDRSYQPLIQTLELTVRDRLVADVPVGVLLSGGVDSSLVTALAVKSGAADLRTFTLGFAEASSEHEAAREIASFLGTRHQELILSPHEVGCLVPSIADVYDEPFADSSAIPTFLVSKLARQSVTVALSGDGADELFGGYTRYRQNFFLWHLAQSCPRPLWAFLRDTMRSRDDSPGKYWQDRFAPHTSRAHAILSALAETDLIRFYRYRVSHLVEPESLANVRADEAASNFCDIGELTKRMNPERAMMFADLVTYLPDDILTKVDRASMAHSLEVRSPFLDDRVVEGVWQLDDAALTGSRIGKRVLKSALQELIPRKLVERPKRGFGLPIEGWLTGVLAEWCAELLSSRALFELAGLRRPHVMQILSRLRRGDARAAGIAWNLVMLSAWIDRFSNIRPSMHHDDQNIGTRAQAV